MSNNVISCENLCVSYDLNSVRATTIKESILSLVRLRKSDRVLRKEALNDVSFHINAGESVAIIGHNGCGKSTLLKTIAGIINPSAGSCGTLGRVAPLIELGAGFDPELTGIENIFLSCALMGLSKVEIEEKLEKIIEFSELGQAVYHPVKTYSSGMYMRLGFSCATSASADVLLIDEILSVGDQNFQAKCSRKMDEIRKSDATIILVSHDISTVQQIAERVIVLNEGRLEFDGAPAQGIQKYNEIMHQRFLASLPVAEREEVLRKERLKDNSLDHVGKYAKITDVSVLSNGEKTLHVAGGESFTINIGFEIFSPMEAGSPVVGFAINTDDGRRLFGANTNIISDIDAPKVGYNSAEFMIRSDQLASGTFSLVVAIHDANLEKTLDIKGDCLRFSIQNKQDVHNFDSDLLSPVHFVEEVSINHKEL